MTAKIETKRPFLRTAIPGPRAQAYLERSLRAEPAATKRQHPVVWDSAEGVWVTDVDGNVFLDFTSSVLIANIGHNHPDLRAALHEQIDQNLHSYNFTNPWRVELVEKLIGLAPPNLDRAFIATTGAEVVELAVHAARQYTKKKEILSFFGGYHGKTYGAVNYGGKASSRKDLGNMPDVIHAPYAYCYRCDFNLTYPSCQLQCFRFVDRLLECHGSNDLAAVILEVYQGSGGQVQPPTEWLQAVARWCRERDAVLILDEVQSSFGRTGKIFAFEHFDIVPNLVVVGKGIAGGIPLTAMLGESRILDNLPAGSLSSTHGGNPLACRAACATIDILLREKLADNAARVGEIILAELRSWQERFPTIGDVRGKGLMIGIEIVEDPQTRAPAPQLAQRIVEEAVHRGLLLIKPIGQYNNVIRVAPPLCLTEDQARVGLQILRDALAAAC